MKQLDPETIPLFDWQVGLVTHEEGQLTPLQLSTLTLSNPVEEKVVCDPESEVSPVQE